MDCASSPAVSVSVLVKVFIKGLDVHHHRLLRQEVS